MSTQATGGPGRDRPDSDPAAAAQAAQELLSTSLEEIEGQHWGEAPADGSALMRAAYRYRTIPLGQLGAEGLRLLIGQGIGLDVLVPLAVGMLRVDPFVEGDFHPGDLLEVVLQVPRNWFTAHEPVAAALDGIVAAVDHDAVDEYGLRRLDDTQLPDLLADWQGNRH